MNILITGANGGLGIAIARYFLENNPEAHTYLGTRNNTNNTQALAAEFPNRTTTIKLDVTNETDWQQTLQTIEDNGQKIAVLVNNAGHHDDHLLATMPQTAWKEVIDSNLTATFLGSQAVIKHMMHLRFGRIINIASLSAIMAPLGQTNYAAAKAGTVALTQSLAKEVARMGITVNAICPGYIQTPALDHLDKDAAKALKKSIPIRRFAEPSEIASAVHYLASKPAAYITGANLKIDGGIF